MCCLNVWPSASLQLYIVAHCDKQLHAPELHVWKLQKSRKSREKNDLAFRKHVLLWAVLFENEAVQDEMQESAHRWALVKST